MHVRVGSYGRAFVKPPSNPIAWIVMRARGWRPFNGHWWSKASPSLRAELSLRNAD